MIAIPPVNDVLLGDQSGVGYTLADQLNFAELKPKC